MISYADIQKANETLSFTDVKGKNYAEVPQRVKAFRMLFPDGFIMTDMISNEAGVCVFKASAGYYDESGIARILGTGTAYEREGSSFINKTSYIENCETSAVGRALGFINLGSDTSIASAEEVANAVLQQQKDETKKSDAQQKKSSWDARNAISLWCKKYNLKMSDFCNLRAALVSAGIVKDIKSDDLTPIDFDNLCYAILDNYKDALRLQA